MRLTRIIPFIIVAIVVIAAVVFINEGQRRIPSSTPAACAAAACTRRQTQYLPLKVTMAGRDPDHLRRQHPALPGADRDLLHRQRHRLGARTRRPGSARTSTARTTSRCTGRCTSGWSVFFTYFYTAFQFRPDQTADYLRKNGGFIPGIRPGKPTEQFLARVTNRITLGGALFLGSIAVLPYIMTAFIPGTENLQLGGTSILIMVSVVVETMKQLEAQMMMRHYEGFIR